MKDDLSSILPDAFGRMAPVTNHLDEDIARIGEVKIILLSIHIPIELLKIRDCDWLSIHNIPLVLLFFVNY